jgi:uncharacterized protein (DUF1015 family)
VLTPFRGVRYADDRVSGIANVTSPPYDVISDSILERLRAADTHNIVRLILPGKQAGASQVAADLLREWRAAGVLLSDDTPALYVYEQAGEDSSWLQRGIISLVRLGSPETAGILPHENVMPGLVANRRALMAATQANLEPIFLIYDGARAGAATQIIDAAAGQRPPLLSVTTEDGITHRLWQLSDAGEQAAIAADLAGRRALIADGHHRYAAYLALQAEMRAAGLGAGPWDYGMAFLVDSGAYPPRLGAIHRVLPGLPAERAAELAKAAFSVRELPAGLGLDRALAQLAAAGQEGTAFLLAGGAAGAPGYWLLSQPDPVQVAASMPAGASAAWQRLDASVMQQLLIGRLWGIADSEGDVLINHDAADAVRTASGTGATAVLCNPPSFESVLHIAAEGEQVPRKSTSFGPKPRTGLVLRTFS